MLLKLILLNTLLIFCLEKQLQIPFLSLSLSKLGNFSVIISLDIILMQ